MVKNFLFTSFRLALRSTQPPFQGLSGVLLMEVKRAVKMNTPNYFKGQ
jgi:hypothetical protein